MHHPMSGPGSCISSLHRHDFLFGKGRGEYIFSGPLSAINGDALDGNPRNVMERNG